MVQSAGAEKYRLRARSAQGDCLQRARSRLGKASAAATAFLPTRHPVGRVLGAPCGRRLSYQVGCAVGWCEQDWKEKDWQP